ncbi:aminotransferase class III-fold pyridoxal phosphate-dependent enzyme [Notoacmeibacter ruber]|uniref:Aminotransferase class III-fold pyridoxal phosphate-dependent enzyme n=1 Tax=Notoacmeibacter ruber TaxID=2670375 RepID=A0A3L7J3G0_9HYPH|nr:aminotransferase class III-fold pyridoxal phosphate-dependent enzyme [Notoacmeibacter ruber]RLQ85188.1 aminotransferase class III-fold pyridoxal phosphate-dependent enzyme [Notoacmeibacter ruber]
MRFGFIAHPTSPPLKRYVKMLDLVQRSSHDFQSGYSRDLWSRSNLVPFMNFDRVVSANGSEAKGEVRYLPLTAEEMLKDPSGSLRRVIEGAEIYASEGVDIVGLGGFTSIVGRRGADVAAASPVPVTSGNSLTAYAGYRALCQILDWMELRPNDHRVAIVGYPGSIALVIARLLLEEGLELDLVHRPGASAEDMLEHLPERWHNRVRLSGDIGDFYSEDRLFIAATSAGGIIDPSRLLPGSIVIDVALPRDVSEHDAATRDDILIVDGGCVTASDKVRMGGESLNLSIKQQLNACLAETMILALEQRAEIYSIGRTLETEKVLAIGEIAQRHGFAPDPLASYGRRIEPAHVASLRRYHCNGHRLNGGAPTPSPSAGDLRSREHHDTALRFRRHINPYLADFLQMLHCDRVFEKAKGAVLTDTEGRDYLDFVAGYGCLNLGHNPPAITGALQDFLSGDNPNFVQYVSFPKQTSLLAERLSARVGGGLERVFFSNSGTEAVEAALKLARAASPHDRIVHVQNSYHGKTLGALSVTGREKHQRFFRPLVPGVEAVPFDDLDAIENALRGGDVAALILEPILGEGGVLVPSDGYLKSARTLCDRYGAFLILDEIQTGMGRTGRFLASEWEEVQADILCLSKSLSGGLMPIGATLTRADIWDRAYGTSDRFLAHSSTFGGGNMAATAALATLDAFEDGAIIANALDVGESLRTRLREVAVNFPFIGEIRGKGMMLAVAFESDFSGAVAAGAHEFATRLPGDWHMTWKFLPDQIRQNLLDAMRHFEGTLGEMFCMRFVTKLAQDHAILTFLTANSSTVIRLQPPLILTHEQAGRFATAFEETCRDMSTFLN